MKEESVVCWRFDTTKNREAVTAGSPGREPWVLKTASYAAAKRRQVTLSYRCEIPSTSPRLSPRRGCTDARFLSRRLTPAATCCRLSEATDRSLFPSDIDEVLVHRSSFALAYVKALSELKTHHDGARRLLGQHGLNRLAEGDGTRAADLIEEQGLGGDPEAVVDRRLDIDGVHGVRFGVGGNAI